MIRISQAGQCPRRIQLQAWGVKGAPPWEGQERAFAEGNLHEQSILEWAAHNLPGGPYDVHSQQKEVVLVDDGEMPVVVGHIDAVATNRAESVLLEAKCLAARGFQELREKGVKEAHPQYYTQVQLYLASAGLNRAYLVARNKETPRNRMWDMHYEEIVRDPAFVVSEIMRLKELICKIEEREDIEPPYTPQDNWQCRPPWCEYSHLCHPDWNKPVEKALPKEELAPAVEEYQKLSEQIKELTEQRNELRDALLASAGEHPIKAGRWLVKVQERRSERFDIKRARKELEPEFLQQFLNISTYKILCIREV